MIKKITPYVLSFFSEIFLISSSIIFILEGKRAMNKPSMKNSNPIAIIRSFIEIFILVSWTCQKI